MAKEKKIEVRVTALEHETIQRTAAKVGMTMSEYVRKAALNQEVYFRFTPQQMQAYKDLQRVHANFTHITNLIRGRSHNAELVQRIEETLNLVRHHLKEFES